MSNQHKHKHRHRLWKRVLIVVAYALCVLLLGTLLLRDVQERAAFANWAEAVNHGEGETSSDTAQTQVEIDPGSDSSQLSDDASEPAAQSTVQPADTQAAGSFYQKLKAGQDVNILVLGDSVGAGQGSSTPENSWVSMLEASLEESYGSNVSVTNYSSDGATTYTGYGILKQQEDTTEYDLAILCYALGDSSDDRFTLGYEGMIRAVREIYSQCGIVEVIENRLASDSQRAESMTTLSEHYGTLLVDTRSVFEENDSYADKDSYPTDEGQKAYSDAVCAQIDQAVEANRGYSDKEIEPVNDAVTLLSDFQYYPASDFKQVDEIRFELELGSVSGALGIDYTAQTGTSAVDVYIDNSWVSTLNNSVDEDEEEQHNILLVNPACHVDSTIMIVFSNARQAEGFNGIMFSQASE
jgi:hypothetical protein